MLEFFAVDVWMSLSGMGELYEDPEFMSGFEGMFAGPPTATVWAHPAGEWVEWFFKIKHDKVALCWIREQLSKISVRQFN